MTRYNKALVAVLGAVAAITGVEIDEGLMVQIAAGITAILVYLIPNSGR